MLWSGFYLCLCSKLNGFLKTDWPCGCKNPCHTKANKPQLFCSRLWARCVEVNLAAGGNPVGWQMGREEAVPDRCSGLVAVPVAVPAAHGREEAPGEGIGEGAREGSDPARLLICPLCCVFQVHQRLSPWQSVRVVYCSTVVPSDGECTRVPALAWASLTHISFPAPFSGWGYFGWAPIHFGAKEATERTMSRRIKAMGSFSMKCPYKTGWAL